MGETLDFVESLDRIAAEPGLDPDPPASRKEHRQQHDDGRERPAAIERQRTIAERAPVFSFRLDHQPGLAVLDRDVALRALTDRAPHFGVRRVSLGSARDVAGLLGDRRVVEIE